MQKSIIAAIIKIFKIVPIPGFWFKKNHKDNAPRLTRNVTNPIDKFIWIEIPWARTLHGDAPVRETSNKPSPKPKITSPKDKYIKVESFGLKFSGFFELHEVLGIFFIVKNIFFTIIYTFEN